MLPPFDAKIPRASKRNIPALERHGRLPRLQHDLFFGLDLDNIIDRHNGDSLVRQNLQLIRMRLQLHRPIRRHRLNPAIMRKQPGRIRRH